VYEARPLDEEDVLPRAKEVVRFFMAGLDQVLLKSGLERRS
jgi:hypothetical protein